MNSSVSTWMFSDSMQSSTDLGSRQVSLYAEKCLLMSSQVCLSSRDVYVFTHISCRAAKITCSLSWHLTLIYVYIFFLCFDAASSDFGLNLQIYVSSSGQILKRLYVCVDRENVIWSNRSFLCVKRGFWDHVCFFSHVCCCDVQKKCTEVQDSESKQV